MEVITRNKVGSSLVLDTDPATPTADTERRARGDSPLPPQQLLKAPRISSPLLRMNHRLPDSCISLFCIESSLSPSGQWNPRQVSALFPGDREDGFLASPLKMDRHIRGDMPLNIEFSEGSGRPQIMTNLHSPVIISA